MSNGSGNMKPAEPTEPMSENKPHPLGTLSPDDFAEIKNKVFVGGLEHADIVRLSDSHENERSARQRAEELLLQMTADRDDLHECNESAKRERDTARAELEAARKIVGSLAMAVTQFESRPLVVDVALASAVNLCWGTAGPCFCGFHTNNDMKQGGLARTMQAAAARDAAGEGRGKE